jgi:hypothetical protein
MNQMDGKEYTNKTCISRDQIRDLYCTKMMVETDLSQCLIQDEGEEQGPETHKAEIIRSARSLVQEIESKPHRFVIGLA